MDLSHVQAAIAAGRMSESTKVYMAELVVVAGVETPEGLAALDLSLMVAIAVAASIMAFIAVATFSAIIMSRAWLAGPIWFGESIPLGS